MEAWPPRQEVFKREWMAQCTFLTPQKHLKWVCCCEPQLPSQRTDSSLAAEGESIKLYFTLFKGTVHWNSTFVTNKQKSIEQEHKKVFKMVNPITNLKLIMYFFKNTITLLDTNLDAYWHWQPVTVILHTLMESVPRHHLQFGRTPGARVGFCDLGLVSGLGGSH